MGSALTEENKQPTFAAKAGTRRLALGAVALAAACPLAAGGTVRFGLPRAGHVRLDLVSVAGRTVARLADADVAAGWHDARVPAGLASGVYFARLVTPLGRAGR
jgi:hypothetical protein